METVDGLSITSEQAVNLLNTDVGHFLCSQLSDIGGCLCVDKFCSRSGHHLFPAQMAAAFKFAYNLSLNGNR